MFTPREKHSRFWGTDPSDGGKRSERGKKKEVRRIFVLKVFQEGEEIQKPHFFLLSGAAQTVDQINVPWGGGGKHKWKLMGRSIGKCVWARGVGRSAKSETVKLARRWLGYGWGGTIAVLRKEESGRGAEWVSCSVGADEFGRPNEGEGLSGGGVTQDQNQNQLPSMPHQRTRGEVR